MPVLQIFTMTRTAHLIIVTDFFIVTPSFIIVTDFFIVTPSFIIVTASFILVTHILIIVTPSVIAVMLLFIVVTHVVIVVTPSFIVMTHLLPFKDIMLSCTTTVVIPTRVCQHATNAPPKKLVSVVGHSPFPEMA
ncbi:predicted protein [Lichtheimia corymbifera JMRC:FSU:9682]|uniref:Uncharacterized protein n=1 Tax=Lichtheimia corymbifera JMRC:FSU:9682 TaxID=1263082 RepID=A0A068SDA6_9FUNG|nr:predicted protein [Lichtheimia corymbifera JMRC:FSU:9682]